jgi:Cof subfamily protein (haloacid dehalogenase superfamily)
MPKLFAIDLDGTLFYPKKRIRLVSKENVAFIKFAIAQGHQVVFVTSRNRQFVEKVLKQINVDIDFVCRNGCMVVHNHQVILDQSMTSKDVEDVTQYIQNRHPRFMFSIDTKNESNIVYTSNYVWYLDLIYRLYYLLQGRYREAYKKDNAYFIKQVKGDAIIQRLLIYFGISKKGKKVALEESKKLKKKFPQLEIAWINGLIEVATLGTNKATALKLLIEKKGILPKDVIVVGDSGNDIPMFKAFSQSYCMDHAHPEVKKYAKHLIKRVYNLKEIIK